MRQTGFLGLVFIGWRSAELGKDEIDDGVTPGGNAGPCDDESASDVVFREQVSKQPLAQV